MQPISVYKCNSCQEPKKNFIAFLRPTAPVTARISPIDSGSGLLTLRIQCHPKWFGGSMFGLLWLETYCVPVYTSTTDHWCNAITIIFVASYFVPVKSTQEISPLLWRIKFPLVWHTLPEVRMRLTTRTFYGKLGSMHQPNILCEAAGTIEFGFSSRKSAQLHIVATRLVGLRAYRALKTELIRLCWIISANRSWLNYVGWASIRQT